MCLEEDEKSPTLIFFFVFTWQKLQFQYGNNTIEINFNLKGAASFRKFTKCIFCQFQLVPPHLDFILNMCGILVLILYQFGSFGKAFLAHSWMGMTLETWELHFAFLLPFFHFNIGKKNNLNGDQHVHFD